MLSALLLKGICVLQNRETCLTTAIFKQTCLKTLRFRYPYCKFTFWKFCNQHIKNIANVLHKSVMETRPFPFDNASHLRFCSFILRWVLAVLVLLWSITSWNRCSGYLNTSSCSQVHAIRWVHTTINSRTSGYQTHCRKPNTADTSFVLASGLVEVFLHWTNLWLNLK